MGILAFESDEVKVEGLQNYRPLMSVSFLGRYRLMDFQLSNFTNSGVDTIHIYVKEKPRSVFEHVGTGRHYNVNSKHGKLRVMYGEQPISSAVYNTDVRAYIQNKDFILEDKAEYVIISPTHYLYQQDFRTVMDKHIESGVDISVLYTSTNFAKNEFIGSSVLTLDRAKKIKGFDTNRGQVEKRNISLECYVMKKSIFFELLEKAQSTSAIYWFKDIIQENIYNYSMKGIPVSGEVIGINDLNSYMRANLRMIQPEVELVESSWPIYTRTNDSPPTYYGAKAEVSQSSIANGAKVLGKVSNSIVGRNVIIEEGAVVEDCILLPTSYVGKDVHLKGVIVDKHARVEKTKSLQGSVAEPIYINRHDKI